MDPSYFEFEKCLFIPINKNKNVLFTSLELHIYVVFSCAHCVEDLSENVASVCKMLLYFTVCC